MQFKLNQSMITISKYQQRNPKVSAGVHVIGSLLYLGWGQAEVSHFSSVNLSHLKVWGQTYHNGINIQFGIFLGAGMGKGRQREVARSSNGKNCKEGRLRAATDFP